MTNLFSCLPRAGPFLLLLDLDTHRHSNFLSSKNPPPPPPPLRITLSAERRDGSSGFTAGFILGGVVFGALGFLFAPQISSALLSDDQSRLKLPRFLDDADGGDGRGGSRQPMTKQDLADRIAQLNSAIDDVSAQLREQDEAAAAAAAGAEEGEAVTEVAA